MPSSLANNFDNLYPGLYLQKQTSLTNHHRSVDDHLADPDYVILFTWVDAQQQHILKYVHGYSQLFPDSKLILLTTSLKDMIFQSAAAEEARLRVISHMLQSKPDAKVLLHTFSNGGAFRFTQFLLAYRKTFQRRFSAQAMIFDSNPGKGTLRRTVAAAMFSLPKHWLVRLLGKVIVYTFLMSLLLTNKILRRDSVVTMARERLNDPQLVRLQTPRCYLYSKADEMVWWQDVEEHVLQARQRGWQVESVRFTTSGHVNHPKEDALRYWDVVKATWKAGYVQ